MVLAAVCILLFVYARNELLTIFLGVLLAVLLSAAIDWVSHTLHMGPRSAYVFVVFVCLGIASAMGYWLGPHVVTQGHEIVRTVPHAIASLRDNLNKYQAGRDLTRLVTESVQPAQAAGRIRDYATNLVSAITTAIVILAIGLFLAANPRLYREGALKLVPEAFRRNVADACDTFAFALKWWLIGQLIPMGVLGVGTMVGLWLLGVPLAFTLALFTAAMLFLPYVGSVMAYIPTALVAFTKGPEKAMWVTLLYLGVHFCEGYVITPLAQRRAVKLPPALTLAAQLFMWTFAGLLGVLAATPLAAVSLALVQKLYLKEQPEQKSQRAG